MAWYKTGTVSVVNGQTSITGTGTKFATNSRVGDGFNGPDGNWYEVTNIASETVLGIYPAYQGPSLSNAAYIIAPLQGYNKESADRLRAITDSLTVVTSVAGKTGAVTLNKSDVGLPLVDNTSDVNKPISTATQTALDGKKNNFSVLQLTEGGTGATDQQGARTALGLGTSATVPLVSNLTDPTPGRVILTGYGGLGYRDNAPFVGVNQAPANYRTGGVYYGQFVNPQFGTSTGHLITNAGVDANTGSQLFIQTTGALFTRAMSSGVWGNWRLMYDTANTSRASDGTLKGI